ncbi:hypothetical protein Avbf_09285 [Armadillidium vulgare]|nr:hypothetical protein Avbf_09285 [Armadillidium vulgare]
MNIIRQEVGLRGGDLRPPDAPLRPPGVDPVVQHDRVQQDMVQQIPDEQDEREFERDEMAEQNPENHLCEFCPHSFRTKTGLGVHQQRVHRNEYDNKIQEMQK